MRNKHLPPLHHLVWVYYKGSKLFCYLEEGVDGVLYFRNMDEPYQGLLLSVVDYWEEVI